MMASRLNSLLRELCRENVDFAEGLSEIIIITIIGEGAGILCAFNPYLIIVRVRSRILPEQPQGVLRHLAYHRPSSEVRGSIPEQRSRWLHWR